MRLHAYSVICPLMSLELRGIGAPFCRARNNRIHTHTGFCIDNSAVKAAEYARIINK